MLLLLTLLESILKRQLKVVRFLEVGEFEFIVPADVSEIYATGVGGGGGSRADDPTAGYYAGGSSSGEYAFREKISVEPNTKLTIKIGAGGLHNISTGNNGNPTQILKGTEVLFQVLGGRPNTYIVFGPTRGGIAIETPGRPTLGTGGRFGNPVYASINVNPSNRGRGGSNPLGGSALFPDANTVTQFPITTAYGFGYGGGGCSSFGRFNFQGNGGNGALIIEYFTST